jgi:hypothetical protein
VLNLLIKILLIALLVAALVLVYQVGTRRDDPQAESESPLLELRREVLGLWHRVRGTSERFLEEVPLPESLRARQQLYRWRDEDGRLHLSDTLPEGITEYEVIDMPQVDTSLPPDELPVPARE